MYGENAMSERRTQEWFGRLCSGNFDVKDAPRSHCESRCSFASGGLRPARGNSGGTKRLPNGSESAAKTRRLFNMSRYT